MARRMQLSPASRAKRDRFLNAIGARPLIMGILNVTPDSFSDGGQFNSANAALAQADRMIAEGADSLDIGGESTRPEATPVPEAEELRRIEPMVAALAARSELPISIDTYKAAVAGVALRHGAVIVNDVWGFQKDPAMAGVVAESGAAAIVMHNRAERDDDVDMLADMRRFFDRSLQIADRAGIPRGRLALDPGIGFGKSAEQNHAALAGIEVLIREYRLPVLIGVSRKSFLGALLAAGVQDRLIGTIAANLAAAAYGATIFRVHDVAEHVAALKVFDILRKSKLP
jgi:dihydropteroate synthase